MEDKELVSLKEMLAYLKYEVDEQDREDEAVKADIEKIDQFRLTAMDYLQSSTGKTFVSNPKAKTYVKIFAKELFDTDKGIQKNDPTSTKNLLLRQLEFDEKL